MYYHASPIGTIKQLEPRTSNHGVPLVYFSKKRENVLVYLSNAIERYCKETGFSYDGRWEKWGPYGFEKCIRDSIYCAGSIEEADFDVRIPDAAVSSIPVDIESVEFVSDAYEAILQAEKDGLITIMRYEEMPESVRQWNQRTIREEYKNAADHPEYRHFLKGSFPDWLADE